MFIQQLAAADILYTIVAIFPCLVTYSAGRWILGRAWCYISAQISFVPGLANIMLVLAITLHRLLLVASPFTIIRIAIARTGAGCIWVIATLIPFIVHGYYRTKGVFNPDTGICSSTLYENEETHLMLFIFTPLFVLIPLFIITIGNLILSAVAIKQAKYLISLQVGHLESARRKDLKSTSAKDIALENLRKGNAINEDMSSAAGDEIVEERSPERKFFNRVSNRKGLIMICFLSGTFVLSWLPYIIVTLLKMFIPDLPAQAEILAFKCIYINAFANPILYSLTNRRFGKYVKQVIRKMFCCKAVKDFIGSDTSKGKFSYRVQQRNHYRSAKV